jgi:alpha-L-rhamnosidase
MKIFLFTIINAVLFILSPAQSETALVAENLRCDYRVNPRGIDVPQPRLSWTLRSDLKSQNQIAYQILVASNPDQLEKNIGDVWDTGQVSSSAMFQIYYNGAELEKNRDYFWKVCVWNQKDKSAWSETASWSTGLFKDSDWSAKWIGLDRPLGDDNPEAEGRPLSARMLRRDFSLSTKIKRATVFVSGLGLYELYLNGDKIGDHVLAPALTEYNKRTFYNTFDVTEQLNKGKNAVGVILGNGRYFAPRGETPTKTKTYGYPKLLLQLHVEFEDGTLQTLISDESWKLTTDGPILSNNEFDGEFYDARNEMDGWASPDFDDVKWIAAELSTPPGEQLVAQTIEPIRVTESLKPVSVNEIAPGTFIFDMGQNMVGWARLRVEGKKGDTINLRFAEVLNDQGELYLDNIRGAKVTDTYICKGEGTEMWEPRFTYHGFRYVELTGYPGTPDLSSIEGRVVHDDLDIDGHFECSNSTINQIYKNAFWGIRGNYRSIPTDCPQRDERQGWLGDRSNESRGESKIFNVSAFYSKWLDDMRDAQLDNGSIPDVAPSYWPIYSDNTTWPGSYIIIPAMLYDVYGDVETIRRHYPTMKKWIDHMSGYLKNDIMPQDKYGDWCVPPEDLKLIHSIDPSRTTSGDFIGTAYFYYENVLMNKYAGLVGREEDAKEFKRRAERLKIAFNKRFLQADPPIYGNNSQTSNVLPLAFGLVPDQYRERILENLIDSIMGKNKGHIGTGLIGCQWLMSVLTDNGRADVAYLLASQTSYPSWGYMTEHDATTIWELWNGDTGDPSMNSHNHVMLLGDLITWFYEYLGGIKFAPNAANVGSPNIKLQPYVLGDLTWVNASYRSRFGLIKSEWKIKGDDFYWDVSIPPNTTARLILPDAEGPVKFAPNMSADIKKERIESLTVDGKKSLHIGSGSYSFVCAGVKISKPESYVATPVISPSDTTVKLSESIIARITCTTPGAEIYYTLDGSEPGLMSNRYTKPFNVALNAHIKTAAVKSGFHNSWQSSAAYDFIDPKINGARWDMVRGRFANVADFIDLPSTESGIMHQINLDNEKFPHQNFALKFTSTIEVPVDGEYIFYATSNDGSQLFVDGKLVADNDGEHGAMEKGGAIQLKAGNHELLVAYFQSGGGQALEVSMRGPGLPKRRIPASTLFLQK